MRPVRSLTLCIATVLGLAHAAAADPVSEWGARAVAIGAEKQLPTSRFARALAMTHVAMFEAVNAIEPRYRPYRLPLEVEPGASREAAASAAAHAVLVSLFPDDRPKLDPLLEADLAALPQGEAKQRGIALGRKAGAGIVALRTGDGSSTPESYRPQTQPGVYVPTTVPAESTTAAVRPWVMDKGAQFRPAPPPALDSETWTRDLNEIRTLGGLQSGARSAVQTEIGRFWFLTGPRTYMPLVQQVAEARMLDLVDRARLYAMVNMAATDALIAVFDAKYAFNFWRPITAIRNADQTRNAATPREAAWAPLGTTPMHPEYPCAHCIVSAAVAEVLQSVGGDAVDLTLANGGVTRRWSRLTDYSNEVSEARIYAGFHYRFSTEAGQAMGKRIGALAVTTQMPAVTRAQEARQ